MYVPLYLPHHHVQVSTLSLLLNLTLILPYVCSPLPAPPSCPGLYPLFTSQSYSDPSLCMFPFTCPTIMSRSLPSLYSQSYSDLPYVCSPLPAPPSCPGLYPLFTSQSYSDPSLCTFPFTCPTIMSRSLPSLYISILL